MNIAKIYELFPNQESCIAYLEEVRWSNKPVCPYCGSQNTTRMAYEFRHHCNNCDSSFGVTVGTVFHHTHLPIQKWFLAIWFIMNSPKKISARQLADSLQVNKNTAWRMTNKIRDAMNVSWQREFLFSIAEIDKAHSGGKP